MVKIQALVFAAGLAAACGENPSLRGRQLNNGDVAASVYITGAGDAQAYAAFTALGCAGICKTGFGDNRYNFCCYSSQVTSDSAAGYRYKKGTSQQKVVVAVNGKVCTELPLTHQDTHIYVDDQCNIQTKVVEE